MVVTPPTRKNVSAAGQKEEMMVNESIIVETQKRMIMINESIIAAGQKSGEMKFRESVIEVEKKVRDMQAVMQRY
jgi:hypothetical protein